MKNIPLYPFEGQQLSMKEILARVPAYKRQWMTDAINAGCKTVAELHHRFAHRKALGLRKPKGGSQYRRINREEAEVQKTKFITDNARYFVKSCPPPHSGKFATVQAAHAFVLTKGYKIGSTTIKLRLRQPGGVTWEELVKPCSHGKPDTASATASKKYREGQKKLLENAVTSVTKRKVELGID